jgi:hypothetical protein
MSVHCVLQNLLLDVRGVVPSFWFLLSLVQLEMSALMHTIVNMS